jgi:ubiquinone biosynthesis protein
MLKERLVPTALIDAATREPVRIGTNGRFPKMRKTLVVQHIVGLLGTVVWRLLTGKLSRRSYARLFRRFCEDLGGLWIKAGQLLSYRVDIFSPEFCQEMSNLQAQAVGFAPEIARQIIEEELGAPIDTYFDEFTDTPFAAASIGQIHRAHLRYEDMWVAVKVQRPYLQDIFDADLAIIEIMIRFLLRIRFRPFMRWDEGMRELRQMMREELDCRYEAAAFRRMRKTLGKHNVYVPKVFKVYNRKRVIVTEFVHAALVADYIMMQKKDPGRLADWLDENNIKPAIVSRRLLLSLYRQIFEDNLYHGDLHPGNIILLRNSRLALIDFGAIAFTENELLDRFRILFRAMASRDYAKAADTALLLGGKVRASDLEAVRSELVEVLRDWGTRVEVMDLPYYERKIDSAVVEITQIMAKYKCEVKWSFLRMRRATAALDASLVSLDPEINIYALMKRYIRKSDERDYVRARRGLSLVWGMNSLQSVMSVASENAKFQGASERRKGQIFEATTSKFAYLMAIVFGQIAVIQFLAGGFFMAAFLQQYYPNIASVVVWDRLADLAGRLVPRLDYPVWVGLMLVGLVFFVNTLKLRRKFAERETQVSDGSSL